MIVGVGAPGAAGGCGSPDGAGSGSSTGGASAGLCAICCGLSPLFTTSKVTSTASAAVAISATIHGNRPRGFAGATRVASCGVGDACVVGALYGGLEMCAVAARPPVMIAPRVDSERQSSGRSCVDACCSACAIAVAV